jgi:hypothetical protein
MKKAVILSILFIVQFIGSIPVLLAQGANDQTVEMAETFRTDGKIYVVVLVAAIVFTGLVLFAMNTERKIARVEKEIQGLKSSGNSQT